MEKRDKERIIISSIVLALMIAAVILTADYAKADEGANIFSVSVPTCLPIEIDENGTVHTSDNLKIINNAASPIAVSSIRIDTMNGWELADMGTDFTSKRCDEKVFGLSFCGRSVPTDGNADISEIPALEGYEEFTIDYGAAFPVQTVPRESEVIGQCLFTVGYETGRLKGLKIISMPSKTVYSPGENFDPSGMVIAVCRYGMDDEITDGYRIENGTDLKDGQTSVTVSADDGNITKSVSVPIEVRKTVSSVSIISYPYKRSYTAGEAVDITGLEIAAVYSDGSTESITNYTVSPSSVSHGTKAIGISYEIAGEEGTLYYDVTVRRSLTGISIERAPSRTSYTAGEYFDPSGAAVTATFAGGCSEDVTDKVAWSRGQLSASDTSVSCSYSEDGTDKSASVEVTVTERHLSGLAITCAPSRTSYFEGDSFDPSGCSVTASYSDGTAADVTGNVIWDRGILSQSDTRATCTYTDDGRTCSSSVDITVSAVTFERLEIRSYPSKTRYASGETFDSTGTAVDAVYSNGTRVDVTSSVTYSKGVLRYGDSSVRASCTLDGQTKSISISINVYRILSSIRCSTMPSKTTYADGEYFSGTGMVITASYVDGSERSVTGYTTNYDGKPLRFEAPPSTVGCYYTPDVINYISDIAAATGVREADLRRWNYYGNAEYIIGAGIRVLTSDPALDEALLATSCTVNVNVKYSESGNTAYCQVPVTVLKG